MPDIVIIGGGIAGISAGAELAKHASVTVLETEPHLGYHATGRSAAVFILNYGNDILRTLNAMAYPDLQGGLLGETVLSPRGEIMLARPSEMDVLNAYMQGSSGVEVLSPDQAAQLLPVLRKEKVAAAIYEQDAQDIDVDKLLQGCARQLRAAGGKILTKQRVTGLQQTGNDWRITTKDAVLHAGIVINAAGAWADPVAALAGLAPIGVQPYRRSAVMMPLPAEIDPNPWPMFGSISEDWYSKPDAGRLMVSPADEDPMPPQDAWPDDMVLAEGLDRFQNMIDLPLARPIRSWAGLRCFVHDKSPVVGFDPEAKGFFWLAAQGGYGVQTSPALARVTASLCGFGPAMDATLVAGLAPERLRK